MRGPERKGVRRGPALSGAVLGMVLVVGLGLSPRPAAGQVPAVEVVRGAGGMHLEVDGRPFMVLGMNWDYYPIGTTYSYDFWGKPDAFIEAALDREMSLMRTMGVNAIRVYAGIPPRWVRYIYERYGIYSVINHPLGRYGTTVNGVYMASTDYSDPATRSQLIGEVESLVDQFDGVPGVLMWLLGNENNYGLTWNSAETQALPEGERDTLRARYMYSLFGDAVEAIKARDPSRLVAMANGDVQYLDLIAEEVHGLDVFGSNVYRGISFRDLFEVVDETLGVPVMFTEFGSDAFNARTMREDQRMQAYYLVGQWQEIYEQSDGKGRVGNAIGGFTFQWSDGWWKFGQEDNLDVHDTNASWPADAYMQDFVPGQNNMNEEWWGITAKGPPDAQGLYELYPRAAYYALRAAYTLDPYGPGTTLAAIRAHFQSLDLEAALLEARGDRAALQAEELSLVRLRSLRMELETYNTGGTRTSTPAARGVGTTRPAFRGFDTKESFYAGFEADPAPNLSAGFAINVLGSVPDNPIDEIFYENRGRTRTVTADGEAFTLNDIERVKVYSASVAWDEPWFRLDGFYRTGHYHWGYEGDFFNLYREANYGPNLDIYNGIAPVGMEVQGKRSLDGLTLAYGPELWWGANPAVMGKYRRQVGPLDVTVVAQEDIAKKSEASSSFAIPVPPTRKLALSVATARGPFVLELGGLWSGSTKVGDSFQTVEGSPGNYQVLQDEIQASDALGAKAKLTYEGGRILWYAQGAAMGLVADGGPTQTQTFTGWTLRDSGSGNQVNVLTGLALNMGYLQVAPNFLWQRPIVGPIPSDVPVPGRPRNILADPFAVRANRETTGAELLITYDPTPATWMYTWDSDVKEDARFAASVGFVYRHLPTTQDAGIGILGDGHTTFAFPGATPGRDLWEARARIVSKQPSGWGLVANAYVGTGEPNGDDPRLIHRYGGDLRLIRGSAKLSTFARFNDWGPYDYHRDFNLTFPVQLMADLSYALGLPEWFDVPSTRVGIRGSWRSLNEYSPRYCPRRVPDGTGTLVCDPTSPGPDGREWEIRTYLHIGL